MAPVVEMVFHYTTDITLLELANLDRPILRRLMLEAPGTYHHSMVVGSLVEAAAAEAGMAEEDQTARDHRGEQEDVLAARDPQLAQRVTVTGGVA